jgi:hypothetical protein
MNNNRIWQIARGTLKYRQTQPWQMMRGMTALNMLGQHTVISRHILACRLLNLYQNNKGGEGSRKKEMRRRRKRIQRRNGRNFRCAPVM